MQLAKPKFKLTNIVFLLIIFSVTILILIVGYPLLSLQYKLSTAKSKEDIESSFGHGVLLDRNEAHKKNWPQIKNVNYDEVWTTSYGFSLVYWRVFVFYQKNIIVGTRYQGY